MIPKNSVIAFLIFTAVLLTCVLALQQFNFTESGAQAAHNSRAGRYVVATTQYDETMSLFWVANVDAQNLSVFGFMQSGGFALLDSVNLNYVFRPRGIDPRLLPQSPIRRGATQNQQTSPPTGRIRPPQTQANRRTDPNIIRKLDLPD